MGHFINTVTKFWQVFLIVFAFELMIIANVHQHYQIGSPWTGIDAYWMMLGFYAAFVIGLGLAITPQRLIVVRAIGIVFSMGLLIWSAQRYDYLTGGWFPDGTYFYEGQMLINITTNVLLFIAAIVTINLAAFSRFWTSSTSAGQHTTDPPRTDQAPVATPLETHSVHEQTQHPSTAAAPAS